MARVRRVFSDQRRPFGAQTIKRLEVVEGIPQSRVQTLMDIRSALEAAGIDFIGTPADPVIRRSRALAACARAGELQVLVRPRGALSNKVGSSAARRGSGLTRHARGCEALFRIRSR